MQRYIVMTDIHGTSDPNDYHYGCEAALYDWVSASLSTDDPVHGVVHIGDRHFKKDPDFAQNILNGIAPSKRLHPSVPLYNLFGNHDIHAKDIVQAWQEASDGREWLVGHTVLNPGTAAPMVLFQPDVYACNNWKSGDGALRFSRDDLDFYNGLDFSESLVFLSHICLGNAEGVITDIKTEEHRSDPDFSHWRDNIFDPYNYCYMNWSDLQEKPALAISGHLHREFQLGPYVSSPAFLGGKKRQFDNPVFGEIRVGDGELSFQFMRMQMDGLGALKDVVAAPDILPELDGGLSLSIR